MKTSNRCFDYTALTVEEHRAISALHTGTATEHQQQAALAVIVKKLAGAHDLPFVPESDRESTFMAGRSYVGHQILKHVNNPPKE